MGHVWTTCVFAARSKQRSLTSSVLALYSLITTCNFTVFMLVLHALSMRTLCLFVFSRLLPQFNAGGELTRFYCTISEVTENSTFKTIKMFNQSVVVYTDMHVFNNCVSACYDCCCCNYVL